jgi:hypothetical protein
MVSNYTITNYSITQSEQGHKLAAVCGRERAAVTLSAAKGLKRQGEW